MGEKKKTAESDDYNFMYVFFTWLPGQYLEKQKKLKKIKKNRFFSKIRFQAGNSWLAEKVLVWSPLVWICVSIWSIKIVCTKDDESKLWICKTMLLGSDYNN